MRTILLILLMTGLHAEGQVFRPDQIRMYWKGADGKPYMTFGNLVKEHPKLVWAMNGGMFTPEYAPVGLYIENGKKYHKQVQRSDPSVNFGIRPQGIFYLTKDKAGINTVPCSEEGMRYATESGPMLVIHGKVNPNLPEGRILRRNGVGILKDGQVFFAMETMTFLEFAQLFVRKGCSEALYLDGAVSNVWTPGKDTYSEFGVMIGVEK